MNKTLRRFLGLLGVSLALTTQAALALTPGDKLSEKQIAEWGVLTVYDIGGSQIRVIPAQQAGNQITLLINAQGVVGTSRNEVTISEAPIQRVQTVLGQVLPQPLSVQHYEPTGISVARYADFGQAVEGLRVLKTALPDAQVRLPVQYGKQVPY